MFLLLSTVYKTLRLHIFMINLVVWNIRYILLSKFEILTHSLPWFIRCDMNSSFDFTTLTIFMTIFFFPFPSIATRFHSSKLTSGLVSASDIVSKEGLSTNVSGLFGTVLTPCCRSALSIKVMFWCLVHRQLSLVIKDVVRMCFGLILRLERC